MNELSSLGLILLFALLAGHLVKFLRVPEVVGYVLAGVMVGPSGLAWVSTQNLDTLEVFSEVALGLILFSIGSVFEYQRWKSAGLGLVRVTASESLVAGAVMCAVMLALGLDWKIALLLGAIAIETAPASTLMVVRECNASGPLTDTLLGVIGINNIFCLTTFALVAAAIDLSAGLGSGTEFLATLYRSLYPLVWQLIGSVALGFLVGVLLASWASRVTEHGEMLILLTGCVLLCVGAANLLDLSSLIASMAVGATMVNLSAQSMRAFRALSSSDPPFYAIFFVIAGAGLELGLLRTMGVVGLTYVGVRAASKFFGARAGARRAGLAPVVQRFLGFALLSHAGLAIGLALTIQRRFPEIAPQVTAVVLAAVTISELFGPIAARLAIVRSGEARPHDAAHLAVPEPQTE